MGGYQHENGYYVPASSDPEDLQFEPQPMVQWFRPLELVRAGIKALLSSLFGAYADKREVQAALTHGCDESDFVLTEFADADELWFDYAADMGDGFASTYAVARMMAEEELTLEAEGTSHTTRRGRFMVLGGDQVYPTANRTEYWNRFYGPYWAAMPYVENEDEAPRLLAIPGNHDWYDGLTAFSRMFAQPGRWIGGWRTRQRRSYFAIDLGHGWWLWGIDVQLGSEIDQPQIDFFCRCAEESMTEGSKVVLCTAEPAWVYRQTKGAKGEEAYRNLEYFERKIIRRYGHEMVVGLSGDLHAYCRYAQDGTGKQRFVAGGGGAYLYPTHDFPDELHLPSDNHTDVYARAGATHPPQEASRRMTWGALLFPFKNWRFSTLLAGFYLIYSWIVQSVSKMVGGDRQSFLETIATRDLDGAGVRFVVGKFWDNLAHSPPSVLVLAGLVFGLYAFADAEQRWLKALLGLGHAAAHIALLLGLMWTFAIANLNPQWLHLDVNSLEQVALFSAEMYVFGGLLGGLIMGLYLLLANRIFHRHTNEVFLCQSIEDHKHFLRLKRDADGGLTIYPIGVGKVPSYPRGWQFSSSQAAEGRSWFEPVGASMAERAHLIEPPVAAGSAGAR